MVMVNESAAALSVIRTRLREYLDPQEENINICVKTLNTRRSGKKKTTTQTVGGVIGYLFKEMHDSEWEVHIFNVLPDLIQSAIFEYRSFTNGCAFGKMLSSTQFLVQVNKFAEQHKFKPAQLPVELIVNFMAKSGYGLGK